MPVFAFEASGSLKKPSAAELEAANEDSAIYSYTSGTLDDGRHFWAYVAVKPSRYYEFVDVTTARGEMVISEYGEVLRAGFGESPPGEIIEEMQRLYNLDEHYEEKLVQQAKAQQASFMKKQEDKRIADILVMLKQGKNVV